MGSNRLYRVVVGATYPEIGKELRKIMPTFIRYQVTEPREAAEDLAHFNKDGLGQS